MTCRTERLHGSAAAQGFGYMYFFGPENKIAPRFIGRGGRGGGGNVALEETEKVIPCSN